jgi:hypothetical protein
MHAAIRSRLKALLPALLLAHPHLAAFLHDDFLQALAAVERHARLGAHAAAVAAVDL